MKLIFLLVCTWLLCSSSISNDSNIRYGQIQLSSEEKQILKGLLEDLHSNYDADKKMITTKLNGWNYHTDAQSGTFHDVRSSLNYAVKLIDLGDKQYMQRAFDIIGKVISLQDQDLNSKSCGVWPYYMEEPLATKKAPIDYNWADFNAVSLLDIWMFHQDNIPDTLKPTIQKALILAAKSIQKRNVGPGYTNIAIMGTYVTYMVSNLFDLPEMKGYAQERLSNFYSYTLDKGGFSEYNSPTYTIVALDELFRMKRHIIEPKAKKMIDSLYSIGWEMIARHYHQPTGQWSGPHSRSYSTLIKPSFCAILNEATNGKVNTGIAEKQSDVKIKHQIPAYLLHYFLSPEYPRTETDIFEKEAPQTIGTCYLTDKYTLSTASQSSLWNQRRPFLVYWGTAETPKYLQSRFLHDGYDFSSASFFSQQKENNVLAAINFISNGGDKHISIDRLNDGKFKAKDLRLRFEFGNVKNQEELTFPASANEPFSISLDGLNFNMQLYCAEFNGLKAHWEKGGDGKSSWIDLVFYSGRETEFDLTKIGKSVSGFTFSLEPSDRNSVFQKAEVSEKDNIMRVRWNKLKIDVPVKPFAPQNPFF